MPHVRRRVRTGGYERKRFPGSKANLVQTHYGMRVICGRCKTIQDIRTDRATVIGHCTVIAAVVVLTLILLLDQRF